MGETDDELKELKAYKTGYDLGYYRGMTAMIEPLNKINELITMSSTFKKIQREAQEKGEKVPVLFTDIIATIQDAYSLRNELMPTLLIERRAINDLGKRIEALPAEAFTDPNWLTDNINKVNLIDEGEEGGKHENKS